jgi:hypothetical protein
MKLINIKFLAVFSTLALLMSCSKYDVETVNPNQSSVNTFWKTLEHTNIGLNAAYNGLLDTNIAGVIEESIKADMGYPGYRRPFPQFDDIRSFYYKIYNTSGYIESNWNACYTAIYASNQVIEALERIKPTLADEQIPSWETQMGQARFIRGLMHFYLYSSFNKGSVIIRDKVPTNADEYNKALSTAVEVRAFFTADLEYAFEKLPIKYPSGANVYNVGRATKGAAATILGTSYLYEKDYPKASSYFSEVIKPEYGYKLVTDIDLLFTTAGEFNDESIFELSYVRNYRTDVGAFNTSTTLSNTLGNVTTQNKAPVVPVWLIDAYKKEPIDLNDPRNYYVPDPKNPTVKLVRPIPLRASSMVAIIDDDVTIHYLTGTVAQNAGSRMSNDGWGFGFYKKYSNWDIDSGKENGGTDTRGANVSGKNIVLNRLADVYLMQAECLIKTGNTSGALRLINQIRTRWGLQLIGPVDSYFGSATFINDPTVDYTNPDVLMDRLMYVEKPLELSAEGHAIRWFDLRRWGKIKENFERLAAKTFYCVSKTYRKIDPVTKAYDGTTATKTASSIVTDKPANSSGLITIDYEYDDAAANYNPALHDYYPIPASEIARNSKLNNL